MTYFYLIEQHLNGSWWCHQQHNPYKSRDDAEEGFKKVFWWDLDRPHKVIEIATLLPEKLLYSWDCVTLCNPFGFDKYKVELISSYESKGTHRIT